MSQPRATGEAIRAAVPGRDPMFGRFDRAGGVPWRAGRGAGAARGRA